MIKPPLTLTPVTEQDQRLYASAILKTGNQIMADPPQHFLERLSPGLELAVRMGKDGMGLESIVLANRIIRTTATT